MNLPTANQFILRRMAGLIACCGGRSKAWDGSVFTMVVTNIGATAFMNIVENLEIAIEASRNQF